MQKEDDSHDIPEYILKELGLTLDEGQTFHPDKVRIAQEERLLQKLTSSGRDLYLKLQGTVAGDGIKTAPLHIRLYNLQELEVSGVNTQMLADLHRTQVALYGKWTNFPDDIYRQMVYPFAFGSSDQDEKAERNSRVASALLTGFGAAALEQGDYETAVNAFDNVTQGNIFGNENFKSLLANVAQADKIDGVKIAKLLSERAAKRSQGDPSKRI